MAGGTASFGVDGTGIYSVAGYVAGITEEINTPVYINSVLRYAHSRLSDAFDVYLDRLAKDKPDNFMHVYEWPTSWGDDKPNYEETVGQPAHRLWVHTLSGPAANAVASFQFLPSERPSPVNPILAMEGVKTGVHIFKMKAEVMEYGLPIKISPKLAQYLAYVLDGNPKRKGHDSGLVFSRESSVEEGTHIGFSKGQVDIPQAGGGHTKRRFTDAFIAFYSGEAADLMANNIMPRVEQDIMRTANEMGTAGLVGVRSQRKVLNMAGWSSSLNQAYGKAKIEARRRLKAMEQNYIQEAAQRRRDIYGV